MSLTKSWPESWPHHHPYGAPSTGVQFIWKIENFFCPKDASISSPTFSSPTAEWEIIILRKDSNILLKLHTLNDNCTFQQTFKCSVGILDSHRIPVIWKEGKCTNGIIEFLFSSDFSQFTDLDNTLIIQCHIWKTLFEGIRVLPIFAKTRLIDGALEKYFIEETSCIGSLEQQSFKVPILDGYFIEIEHCITKRGRLLVRLKTALFGILASITVNLLHCLTRRKTKLTSFYKKLEKEREVCDFDATLIAGEVKRGFTNLSLELSCRFQKEIIVLQRIVNENECFPPLDISNPKVTSTCNDVPKPDCNDLKKNCSNVSRNSSSTRSEKNCSFDPKDICTSNSENNCSHDPPKSVLSTELHLPNISQILQDMFKEGYMSDFKLRVGERVFPVHRCILGVRSKVFREMFETQGNCNIADIPGIEVDTLLAMLQFIYSNSLDMKMDWVSASCLYSAADKYALESLKQSCSTILKSGLSTSNILKVLEMSGTYQDDDLMSAALEFMHLNDEEIINSELWGKFEEDNPKLAVLTFRKLYLKKK